MEVGRNAVPGAILHYNVHTGYEILRGIETVANGFWFMGFCGYRLSLQRFSTGGGGGGWELPGLG